MNAALPGLPCAVILISEPHLAFHAKALLVTLGYGFLFLVSLFLVLFNSHWYKVVKPSPQLKPFM